jgi:hypothetical protein
LLPAQTQPVEKLQPELALNFASEHVLSSALEDIKIIADTLYTTKRGA